ncbi:MAG: pyridoxamine 5'-phosphate oxidase family protein [Deltaproteobacteria bacterium]|jgi:predicted pyridoxine 5'-phosphate oxidase superfamily flavin-nucleotide-binding protein|nr:pyridoxamine 5'-phosphate oxidase family protein [Deltaproteobacteria bacterium]
MSKLNSEVKRFLQENSIWIFSTCSDKPNSAPVFFKKIDEQDNLVLFDVFMKKGLDNLAKNNHVAITVFNMQTLQGYQIKGTATYTIDEVLVKEGNSYSGKMNLVTKGVIIVKVDEVFIQTPGPDAGKLL